MTSAILRPRQARPCPHGRMRAMGAGSRKTRNEHSSGGVVIALRDGARHVALIATRNKTRWGLPKGAVTVGETSEAAALREVREETGIEARIVRPLPWEETFDAYADGAVPAGWVNAVHEQFLEPDTPRPHRFFFKYALRIIRAKQKNTQFWLGF